MTAFLLVAGCGRTTPSPQEVSGRVTYQQQPLRKGMVEFIPAAAEGSRAGAIIRDGTYNLRTEAGLLPGSYRVSIVPYVSPLIDWEVPPPHGSPITIPPKYNVKTVLTAEVEEGGSQTIDFELD